MPIEISHDGYIVDGEHRYAAMMELGIKKIPAWVGMQSGSSGRLKRPYSGLMIDIEL